MVRYAGFGYAHTGPFFLRLEYDAEFGMKGFGDTALRECPS